MGGLPPPTIPRSRPCECSLKLCKNEWPPRADSSIVEEFGMGIPGMEVWIRQLLEISLKVWSPKRGKT